MEGLGIGGPFQFCDVFGLDPELLAMIPQPCAALVMLFPITDKVRPSSTPTHTISIYVDKNCNEYYRNRLLASAQTDSLS